MANNVSDLEALANIGVNLAEILGVAGGFVSLVGCWIPVVNKYPGLSKGMFIRGFLIVAAAMAQPSVVDYMESVNQIAAAVVAWGLCLPIVFAAFKAYALPGSIALKRNLKNKEWIVVLNCLVIVPFHLAWFISLFLATTKSKADNTSSSTASESVQETNTKLQTHSRQPYLDKLFPKQS